MPRYSDQPKQPPQPLPDWIEDRARADAGYAIAFGLLAEAQDSTAAALRMLGFADAATPMGAIEHLCVEIRHASERIASALGHEGL